MLESLRVIFPAACCESNNETGREIPRRLRRGWFIGFQVHDVAGFKEHTMGDHTFKERKKEEMKIKISLLMIVFVMCLLPLQVFAECTEGNCSDGKGTVTFPGGQKYVGQFKNGLREGKGTMTFPDTRTSAGQKQYEGEWKEDKPSGKGTVTFYDGRKFVGEWKFEVVGGLPVMMEKSVVVSGRGTMFYPDGRKEVGEFINDEFRKKK
jgi:hypothetical protein